MNETMVIKIGDTYDVVGSLVVDGVAEDLTGVTITSQVRDSAGQVAWDCIVSSVDATHFRLRATAAMTAAAAPGLLQSDIRYEYPDGRIKTTPTFHVLLNQRVTP